MLVRLLEVFGKGLVSRLTIFAHFNLILKNVDIIYYVFVLNERYVCLSERPNFFHNFSELILEAERVHILLLVVHLAG